MGFMDKMMSAATVKYGKNDCFVASDYEKYVRVIPLTSPGQQVLFGANGFPLNAILEFAGPPGSGKSAFAFQLLSEFLVRGMNGVLIETENKLSPTLLKSILGAELYELLIIWKKCTQVELWQDKMTFTLKEYTKAYNASVTARKAAIKRRNSCKRKESRDKVVIPPLEKPMLIVLDSLGGVLSEDSAKSINTDGYASKSYPVEALKNSKYFSSLPEKIRDVPVSILYTNHKMLNMNADSAFGDNDRTKGGATPAFFCSHRFFFEEMSALRHPTVGHYEQTMRIKCVKNALNQRSPMRQLIMSWDKWVEDGDECQKTQFGWSEMLTSILAPAKGSFSYDREAVKEFLAVKFTSLVKYSCPQLKLVDVHPKVIGDAITADPEVVRKLMPYLGVKQWPVFSDTDVDDDVTGGVTK
jgi:RecA/RadA recombinase